MSPEAGSATRIVVIPIGVGQYSEPSAAAVQRGRQRFPDLRTVETDIARVRNLFADATFREAGFEVLPTVSGSAGTITDELTRIADDLSIQVARAVILLWSGHGEAPGEDLRLATQESVQPMDAGDGLAPSMLVDKLVGSGARFLYLILDVCQAGAAASNVTAAAGQRFREQPPGSFVGMAALFSAHPFEQAVGGVFVETLERVLRGGPSSGACEVIARTGWGGFNQHNRLVTADELEDVLAVEFEVLRNERPSVQSPVGGRVGRPFGLFPNPLFQANAASETVETVRQRWLKQDVLTHFLPKARGLEPGEQGWFFTGRRDVSREIVNWLVAKKTAPTENLYILMGDGGTGKSAILGRLVSLTDAGYRAAAAAEGWNESEDRADGTVPPLDGFDAALHLRNLSAEVTMGTLSELLRIRRPDKPDDFASFVANAPVMFSGSDRPITIAVDALDEATDPVRTADQLLRPLATKGWRILVGTRLADAHRKAPGIVDRLGPAHYRNLDDEHSTDEDIAAYVTHRLTRSPSSPYRKKDAETIATKVAAKAKNKFLYGRITVSGLLRHPSVDLSGVERALADSVGTAFSRELDDIDVAFQSAFPGQAPASALLQALAWGEGRGLPARDGLWLTVATAVAGSPRRYNEAHAKWVQREAGRYIVESGDGEQAIYRLFHQSLSEYFTGQRDAGDTRRRIGSALYEEALRQGWADANPYLVRHLPEHLDNEPERLEQVCTDPDYLARGLDLLGADGLVDAVTRAWRASGLASLEVVAKALGRARVALTREPSQLAGQLSSRLAREDMPGLQRLVAHLPSAAPAIWLCARPDTMGWRAHLETTQTFNAKVRALAIGEIEGNPVIAVGAGANVFLWDPRRGALGASIASDRGLRATATALGIVDGRDVVAVASNYDATVVVRDFRTREVITTWDGHSTSCAIGTLEEREVLAVMGDGHVATRTLDSRGPIVEHLYRVDRLAAIGRCAGRLIAVEQDGRNFRLFDLTRNEGAGPWVEVLDEGRVHVVGEWRGQPYLAVAGGRGVYVAELLREYRGIIARATPFDYTVRGLAVGEIETELVIVAGNDSDREEGYVTVRQPTTYSQDKYRNYGLSEARFCGVGRSGSRLILLTVGGDAIDVETSQFLYLPFHREPIEVLRGVRSVQGSSVGPPPRRYPSHGTFKRDAPWTWPVSCEAWGIIDEKLVQARGSALGAVWVMAVEEGRVLAGPFIEVGPGVDVRPGKKSHHFEHYPADGVALGSWGDREVVAVAFNNRARVADVRTGEPLGSPETGDSEIVTVAVGDLGGRSFLVTGSRGGRVGLWEAPSLRRVAGLTLDTPIAALWLAENEVIVRGGDDQLHILDVEVGDQSE